MASKIAPGDLKAILRLAKVNGAEASEKHIDNIKVTHPVPVSTLIAFRFNKRHFFALFDETADDDIEYLFEQIKAEAGTSEGAFLENQTGTETVYGLPFKGKTVYLYSVDAGKKRLDLWLAENYPDMSRSTWQKHIKAGRVSVNRTVITSPKTDVSVADNVAIHLPDEPDYSADELPIIYIDENVIVINKPVGVLAHAKGAENDEFTVADFFARYTGAGLDTNRPGIVHRLDRDTSGIMIGARNEEAQALLARQFADRKTKKIYVAILSGTLKQKEATIELPIGRNPSAPSTFRVDAGGRMAITHYKVLAENNGETLVELRPVTGRTHQLRVHMAYLGAPIKGDRVYGRPSDRLYLHAKSLEITIPKGDRRVFEAPLPDAFKGLFKEAL